MDNIYKEAEIPETKETFGTGWQVKWGAFAVILMAAQQEVMAMR